MKFNYENYEKHRFIGFFGEVELTYIAEKKDDGTLAFQIRSDGKPTIPSFFEAALLEGGKVKMVYRGRTWQAAVRSLYENIAESKASEDIREEGNEH